MSAKGLIDKYIASEAFYRLNSRFESACIKCDICLYGGSALMFLNDLREVSLDVDYRIVSFEFSGEYNQEDPEFLFRLAAMEVGEELGLGVTWMNDAAKIFASRFEKYGEAMSFGDALTVFVPLPEYLLAMKCRCVRGESGNHDREDIISLMAVCGITTLEQLEENFRAFYPDQTLSSESLIRLESICMKFQQDRCRNEI